MITQALAPDRRHRAITVRGQADTILFAPADLPRNLDTAPIIFDLERIQYRCGRLATNLETLPEPAAMQRLLGRWDAVVASASNNASSDFLSLLTDERRGAGREGGPSVAQAANFVTLFDQFMADGRLSAQRTSPEQIEARIKEIHAILTANTLARGTGGVYRGRVTGVAGFVVAQGRIAPPPAELIHVCMLDLAGFIASPPPIPLLLRIAMVWAQLLAIAPFDYGNQMVCHALTALMATGAGYAPLFNAEFAVRAQFKARDALRMAILQGVWTPWFEYFLHSVDAAVDTLDERIQEITAIIARWDKRLGNTRQHSFAHAVVRLAACHPAITTPLIRARFGMSAPTARAAIERLVETGILRLYQGARTKRIYIAPEVVSLFTERSRKPETLDPQSARLVRRSMTIAGPASPPDDLLTRVTA